MNPDLQERRDLIDENAIQKYVLRRQAELLDCRAALKLGDFGPLREMAHKIMGNCLTFGFEELQPVAEMIHAAAVQANLESCEEGLEGLQAWIESNLK